MIFFSIIYAIFSVKIIKSSSYTEHCVKTNEITEGIELEVYTQETDVERKKVEIIQASVNAKENATTLLPDAFKKYAVKNFKHMVEFKRNTNVTIAKEVKLVYIIVSFRNLKNNLKFYGKSGFDYNEGEFFTIMARTYDDENIDIGSLLKGFSVFNKIPQLHSKFSAEDFKKISNIFISDIGSFKKLQLRTESNNTKLKILPDTRFFKSTFERSWSQNAEVKVQIKKRIVPEREVYGYDNKQILVQNLEHMFKISKIHIHQDKISKTDVKKLVIMHYNFKYANEMFVNNIFRSSRDNFNRNIISALNSFFVNFTASISSLLQNEDNLGVYSIETINQYAICKYKTLNTFNNLLILGHHAKMRGFTAFNKLIFKSIFERYGINLLRKLTFEELQSVYRINDQHYKMLGISKKVLPETTALEIRTTKCMTS